MELKEIISQLESLLSEAQYMIRVCEIEDGEVKENNVFKKDAEALKVAISILKTFKENNDD